ncbi:AC9 transposase [Ceratobasidium theobromae]|uniref:AC9 transposase n=1 Tax=Ceratobasidium theobromae TaxID=1582974 RepID=A0A5N5QD84_9AGAM|nr:AC9 transposase [Ceratobasidium theobromae]
MSYNDCTLCRAGVQCPYHQIYAGLHGPSPAFQHDGFYAGPHAAQIQYYRHFPANIPSETYLYYNTAQVSSAIPPAPVPPTSPVPTQKRRSGTKTKTSRAAKRARNEPVQAQEAGVGPSTRVVSNMAEAAELAAKSVPLTYNIDNRSQAPGTGLTGTSDCWLYVIGTVHKSIPPDEQIVADTKLAGQARLQAEPSSLRRPTPYEVYPRLLCVPCLMTSNTWKTWSNTDGGSTTGIVTTLKIHMPLNTKEDELMNEPITPDGIARYIAELVAEQDLSLNFVESHSFRRLLAYVGQNNIMSKDLPKRRVIARMASDLSHEAKTRIKEELKRSFMVVTGHFLSRIPRSAVLLLAFRFIEGSHTGANISDYLFHVLEDYDILHMVGSITLDNASDSNTMMESLQFRMAGPGYSFGKATEFSKCFPPVIKVLQDIKCVLDIPHKAQELFAFEQTPCLSLATKQFPALAFAIEAAIEKIREYMLKARSSPIHILAMFLNPCVKYKFIDSNWSAEEQLHARNVVKRFTNASWAQGHGLNNLSADNELEYSPGQHDAHTFGTVTPAASPIATRTAPTFDPTTTSSVVNPTPSKNDSHRAATVDSEHDRYVTLGVLSGNEFGKMDLVRHWNTQMFAFPLIYAVSMDVLPAQASSVYLERLFSSRKLTCTQGRNKISAETVESLQILKYSLRHLQGRALPPAIDSEDPQLDPDTYSSRRATELMLRPGDCEWNDDAILDVNT